MRKFILVLLFLLPNISYAEEDIRIQVIDGKKFMCFDEFSSKELFQLRLDYPKLKTKIVLLEEKVDTQTKMILSLEDANTSLNEQNVILADTNAKLEEKVLDGEHWYLSPYLWVVIGVIGGVALTVGVMYAVN